MATLNFDLLPAPQLCAATHTQTDRHNTSHQPRTDKERERSDADCRPTLRHFGAWYVGGQYFERLVLLSRRSAAAKTATNLRNGLTTRNQLSGVVRAVKYEHARVRIRCGYVAGNTGLKRFITYTHRVPPLLRILLFSTSVARRRANMKSKCK